jgi:hypothetical protein
MNSSTLTAELSASRGDGCARPLLHAVAAETRRDWPLFLVVAAYVAVVWGLCEALGRGSFFRPLVYMAPWVAGLVAWLGLYVIFKELPLAWQADPKRPMRSLAIRLRPHMTPKFASAVLLFLSVGLMTGTFTCAKSLMNDVVPFHSDALLARLDAALFMGVDPWRVLQPILGHPLVTRVIQNIYLFGWTGILVGVVTAVTFSPRLRAVRRRFFIVYFAAWIVLGNIVAAAFLSGGPVYFAAFTGDHARYAPLLHYLSFSNGLENSSFTVQRELWWLHEHHKVGMGAGISAFPSLHVAMATLYALTA